MSLRFVPLDLEIALQQDSQKIAMRKGEVLFRRGESACGIFVLLSGRVILDLGLDACFPRTYEAGALLGLSATLTRGIYSMTATVMENAVVAFWSREALESLLQRQPRYYRELVDILEESISGNERSPQHIQFGIREV